MQQIFNIFLCKKIKSLINKKIETTLKKYNKNKENNGKI